MNPLIQSAIEQVKAEHDAVLARLIAAAAIVCGVTPEAVLSAKRDKELTEARAVVCVLASREGIHPGDIARALNRDRTTVLFHIKKTATGLPANDRRYELIRVAYLRFRGVIEYHT